MNTSSVEFQFRSSSHSSPRPAVFTIIDDLKASPCTRHLNSRKSCSMPTAHASTVLEPYACLGCGLSIINDKQEDTRVSKATIDVLLKSNHPPPPVKKLILRQEYAQASRDDASLNSAIERLRFSLRLLEQSQVVSGARVQDLRTVLSPVRYLPSEILAMIFRDAVDEDTNLPCLFGEVRHDRNAYPSVTLDTTKSPWTLSRVCRRWRNLALALPQLWSVLDINWAPARMRNGRYLASVNILGMATSA
ncbi:hypothetical protein PM082_014620 [Marasmius tenuissimus]|nr:hypothetical protein PM082_014620 [Marasmius tenuissimus]